MHRDPQPTYYIKIIKDKDNERERERCKRNMTHQIQCNPNKDKNR